MEKFVDRFVWIIQLEVIYLVIMSDSLKIRMVWIAEIASSYKLKFHSNEKKVYSLFYHFLKYSFKIKSLLNILLKLNNILFKNEINLFWKTELISSRSQMVHNSSHFLATVRFLWTSRQFFIINVKLQWILVLFKLFYLSQLKLKCFCIMQNIIQIKLRPIS